jgi:hypothetical protein
VARQSRLAKSGIHNFCEKDNFITDTLLVGNERESVGSRLFCYVSVYDDPFENVRV